MGIQELAQELKKRREERGLSQGDIRLRTGKTDEDRVTVSEISVIENAKRAKPNPIILRKLAPAYGMTEQEIMSLAFDIPYSEKVVEEAEVKYITEDISEEDLLAMQEYRDLPEEDRRIIRQVIKSTWQERHKEQ